MRPGSNETIAFYAPDEMLFVPADIVKLKSAGALAWQIYFAFGFPVTPFPPTIGTCRHVFSGRPSIVC